MRLRYKFEFGNVADASIALKKARRQKKRGRFVVKPITEINKVVVRANVDGGRLLKRLGYVGIYQ